MNEKPSRDKGFLPLDLTLAHMLFRHLRTLIGVAPMSYDSNGVRFELLTSLGQSLTFQVG